MYSHSNGQHKKMNNEKHKLTKSLSNIFNFIIAQIGTGN